MKKTNKLFGAIRSIAIIALVAVIGFSMATCGGDEEEGDKVTSTYSTPSTNVHLTISGLGAYEGKYVRWGANAMQSGSGKIFESGKHTQTWVLPQISGGSATLNVWGQNYSGWTGLTESKDLNFTRSAMIYIFNSQSITDNDVNSQSADDPVPVATSSSTSVTFTNGVGSINASSLTFN